MSLKQTPMTFTIKFTRNFGPLNITFSLRCLFSAKMAIFCVFDHIGYREPKEFNQNDLGASFKFIGTHFYHNQNKIQNFLFFFFVVAFPQVPMGYVESSDPLLQGGCSELISKFWSSMILYNHSSYFKSGEINNCRFSPLPTLRCIYYFS